MFEPDSVSKDLLLLGALRCGCRVVSRLSNPKLAFTRFRVNPPHPKILRDRFKLMYSQNKLHRNRIPSTSKDLLGGLRCGCRS